MLKDTIRQIVNIVSTLIPVVVGGLVGNGVAEGSNRNPVLITPAGYTFAIWGLIFIATIVFAIYQALPSQRENPRFRHIGYWYTFGNLLCAAWDLIFPRNLIALSEVVILASVIALVTAYVRAGVALEPVSRIERWLAGVPLGIYAAWVTFATVVNTAVYLRSIGWDGFGIAPSIWAVIVLIVAAFVVSTVSMIRRDFAFAAVGTWALLGVVVATVQKNVTSVAVVAGVLAVVTLVVAVFAAVRRTTPHTPELSGRIGYASGGGQ